MMVYGKHSVSGVLQFQPRLIKKIWIKPSWQNQYLLPKSVVVETILPKAFQAEGVVAEVSDVRVASGKVWDFVQKKFLVYVCVDHVEDPQNLGAIARAAALLGAQALVFPQDRQARITPVVVKASAGMIFALDLIEVSNLVTFLQKFKKATQGWVYGLRTERAEPLHQLKGSTPCALVVGSEGKGISKSTAAVCDAFYAIPMTHERHSLNVAQATAIGLYQLQVAAG